jgi:hypothetical protein
MILILMPATGFGADESVCIKCYRDVTPNKKP